jgi:hypothetical protein
VLPYSGLLIKYAVVKGAFMTIINNVTEVLYRIRAKLYPNYLNTVEGEYITRINNEAALAVEQV